MKKDGNVLITLSSGHPTPTAIVSTLLELDIHLPADRNALVVDHFNYDSTSASEKHDVLLVPYPKLSRDDVRNYFGGGGLIAVPRAVGQTLGNDSPLLAPILRAPKTAYSYSPKEEADIVEDPFATGEQLTLVSSVQAHNSARLVVLGSAEMLQNDWFGAKATLNGQAVATANQDFVRKVAGWTFKELGVIKVGNFQHYLDDGPTKKKINDSSFDAPENNPTIYRIKNDVVCVQRVCSLPITNFCRHSMSKCPNGMATASARSAFLPRMLSNSNSACSPPSIVSTSLPSTKPITRPSTASASEPPISTAFSTSVSITAGPS